MKPFKGSPSPPTPKADALQKYKSLLSHFLSQMLTLLPSLGVVSSHLASTLGPDLPQDTGHLQCRDLPLFLRLLFLSPLMLFLDSVPSGKMCDV